MGPGLVPGVSRVGRESYHRSFNIELCVSAARLTLALLVARVFADHHDAAVATNHLAFVTDSFNAGLDLHNEVLWSLASCSAVAEPFLTAGYR